MNTLSLKILSSPDTNDHELRIFIDGIDLLDANYMGMDPVEFFGTNHFEKSGELIIGRCECGVVGCSDWHIKTRIHSDTVEWFLEEDHSWEDAKRRVERLRHPAKTV